MNKIELYYHRAGEPFVRRFTDGLFIDQERKLKVIIEQGKEKLHNKYPISDIDFCRADYQRSLHMKAVKACQKASNLGWKLDRMSKYLLISSSVAIFYIFVSYNGMFMFYDLIKSIINIVG